ncbi:CATRA conflict system CASPASE/TPR repeat-associated protein [Streptomyces sp. NPDC051287]|uniref:CATRA conflict system CASPASE/TPR repeat-associated protein n=1 Tax=Streptomyces sp. NPDC051287 TaxID=3365648 RepID=UPI00378E397E
MTRPPIDRAALVTHLFLTAEAVTASGPARELLERRWEAGRTLGLTQPVPVWSDTLPDLSPDGLPAVPTLLAARQDSAAGAYRMLLVTGYHDMVAVSALLAPNDSGTGWDDLLAAWHSAAGDPPHESSGLLGGAELLLGNLSATALSRAASGALRDLALPLPPVAGGLTHHWTDPAPYVAGARGGVRLWELPAGPGAGPRHRRLLALAAHADDAELSHWAWQGDVPGAAPATRYLLHAARARHQRDLLRGQLSRLNALSNGSAERRRAVSALLSPRRQLGADSAARLPRLDEALASLGASQGAMTEAAFRLRQLDVGLEACEENLTRDATHVGALLDQELRELRWAQAQSRTLSRSYGIAGEQLAETARQGEAAADRLHQARRDRLTLMQTSVLGALLMALTAVQSLGYALRLPGPVQPALITFLACFALVLPALALPRSEAALLGSFGGRADAVAFAAAGASTGWLISATAPAVTHHAPRTALTWLAVALGLAVGVGVRRLVLRHSRG